jgi:signal transduction histidine kinase/CheY-like chemotaxis protein
MTVHQALPLVALALNASLVGLSLGRNPTAPSHRVFACFASGMAVWNFGVFMLRRAPDPATAVFWEVVIHAGVVLLPAFYAHFVASFLDDVAAHRRALTLAYGLALFFLAVDLVGSPAFLRGVVHTTWGWAPATGPLYPVFLVYFNAFLLMGIIRLRRARRRMESSFRRSRVTLIVVGTAASLVGGAVDFVRFLVAPVVPLADLVYPIGIPANALFGLLLGISIIRYRMFDVAVTAKKAAVYVALAAVLTTALVVAGQMLGDPLWIAVVVGILLLTPLGRWLEEIIERGLGHRQRGCYATLLRLSRQMDALLDVTTLTETLVHGLVRGIPLTHCALMIREPSAVAFTGRMVTAQGETDPPAPLPADGPLARWLADAGGVIVKEEAERDPRIPRAVVGELRGVPGALLVPLTHDEIVTGILVLGEKLSGEVFTAAELEVIGALASHAATALANARLYQRAQQAYDELSRTQQELIQAQKMEAIGRLAGGLAHDFNNLLTVVAGRADVIRDELPRSNPLHHEARLIRETADRAAALTRQLLAFGRKQILQPRPLDLNALVLGLAPMLRRLIGEDIELVTLAHDGPLTVKADLGQIEQVIVNLAVHARGAMPRGGRLTLETSRPGPAVVQLAVSDTGVGMDDDLRRRVFEPFLTTTSLGEGTGLGLAMVYGIVRQSGGDIRVESAPDLGTTFAVTLPFVAEPLVPIDTAAASNGSARGTETVLLVEDEEGVRALARDTLRACGYRVLEAADGEAALDVSAQHHEPIHLLLTDVVMPRMGGPELARRLATARPELRVLFMSGYADLPRTSGDMPLPLIEKPFQRDTLVRRVRERLDQRT